MMDTSKASQRRMTRARIVISGRVQGVYFRASARDVARAQRLSGWVQNRIDGAVEALVEGEQEAVQAFIAWCYDGPPGAHVIDVQAVMDQPTGEFEGFRVRG
jgi:acylphosphatase